MYVDISPNIVLSRLIELVQGELSLASNILSLKVPFLNHDTLSFVNLQASNDLFESVLLGMLRGYAKAVTKHQLARPNLEKLSQY